MLFLGLTALAFFSALRAPFEFDDLPAIQTNASIHDLASGVIPPRNTAVSGRPIANLTLAVNHAINDLLDVDQRRDPDGPNKTVGYHAGNVVLHLLCGILLFGLIRRALALPSFGTLPADPTTIAGFATLLWLVHPIQTDAVDYVVQRTEIIVSLLYVATLYCSLRAWEEEARTRWYALGVAACALGMLSKEVMATAPLMVLAFDRAFIAPSWRSVWANRSRRYFYGALFATLLIVAVSVLSGDRAGTVGFHGGFGWIAYAYTQGWAIAHYLRLIIWPVGLNFDYGIATLAPPAGLVGALVVVACLVATITAWVVRPPSRLAFLGAWFFLLLAPSSSVIPIWTEIAAERRVYLASAGVIVFAVIVIFHLIGRTRQRYSALLLGAMAGALAIATFARGLVYSAPSRLYEDVIRKAPANPRGYTGLASAMIVLGPDSAARATELFRRATEFDSTYFPAWIGLGMTELSTGALSDAATSFDRALRLKPDNLDAVAGRAQALLALGQVDAALPLVQRLGTANVRLLWETGNRLVRLGRGRDALPLLDSAARAESPSAAGWALLSLAEAEANERQESMTAAAAAARDPDSERPEVQVMLAEAMAANGQVAAARAFDQNALRLDPSSREALDLLARLSSSSGRGPSLFR